MKVIRDVINQKIKYKLTKGRYPTSAGTTLASSKRSYPVTITHWKDFEANAANDTDDDNLELSEKEPLAYTLKKSEEVNSEENVRQRIFIDIAEPLSCCFDGTMYVGDCGVHSRDKTNNQNNSLGLSVFPVAKVDILCRNHDDYIVGFGVVKTYWSLSDMPADGDEICRRYHLGLTEDKNWRRVIAQLYGYLIDHCCTYGFTTNYNSTWFCRVGDNDSLTISNGIPCDFFVEESDFAPSMSTTNNDSSSGLSNSKTSSYSFRKRQPSSDSSSSSSSSISGKKRSSEYIAEEVAESHNGQRQNSYLRCMYHFVKIANRNTIKFPTTRGNTRRDSKDFESINEKDAESSSKHCDDSSHSDSQHNVSPGLGGGGDGGGRDGTGGSNKRCGGSEGDDYIDSQPFNLSKTAFLLSRAMEVLGSGRRGIVFKYELEEGSDDTQTEKQCCAVKLVDLERIGNHEALHAELATYKLLQDVQGE